ncbi:MAG: EAL domain-containing protein [Gammaproteobacteria bacterium]|nr:EAL domain-containing protein [Gammaproteobacteria bacterium]
MTLLRQLTMVIVILFALLFVGTTAISVHNTRSYLNVQLHTISQDTATSLGLSLSPHMAENDMVIVESMVNAVFDSGYYRTVIIRSIEGEPVVERVQPVRIEGVPGWFVNMFPLETPQGEALIVGGWQQLGTVTVAANPGHAYATLWSNSLDALWLFLGVSILTFGLGMAVLHVVLRPLRAVEEQARAICDREYPVQHKLPWTLELRSVVLAMNRMTGKVKEMFGEQATAMERLRAESYRDTLTGLANRRYFDMYLRQRIESADEFDGGALLFLELKDFKAFNEKRGYPAGDELLRATATIIEDACRNEKTQECFSAHFSGANFAVVLSNVTGQGALDAGEAIMRTLPRLRELGLIDTLEVGHAGLAIYRGQSVSELLAEADMALRAAQTMGANAVHMHAARAIEETVAYSATRWTEFLRKVIDTRNIILHVQPVRHCGDRKRVMHFEALLRVPNEDGKLIPAGIFLPMAKRPGLLQDFDKLVVSEVLSRIGTGSYGETPVAVNLFPSSIHDTGFVDWLCATLRASPEANGRIAFEVTEYGVLENLDALRLFIRRIGEFGAKVGLDHFGRGFSSFDYLSTVKIDYLKIDGSYIRGIPQNRDNQLFVDSVIKIAHGLDFEVIAESVETEEEWLTLSALRLDGVQGYGVAKPEQC